MAVSSELPDGRAATSTGSPTGSPRSSQPEIFALRHQLNVLHRSAKRPKLADADRVFRAWKVRRKARPFEPAGRRSRTDPRDESREPLWSAPRIHGELFKFALTWARSAPASTWFATENLHGRPGAPSSRITSRAWFRPISVRWRRSGSRSSMCSRCWRTTGATFTTCRWSIRERPDIRRGGQATLRRGMLQLKGNDGR